MQRTHQVRQNFRDKVLVVAKFKVQKQKNNNNRALNHKNNLNRCGPGDTHQNENDALRPSGKWKPLVKPKQPCLSYTQR